MKVCMIITDGFEEAEAIGSFAILKRGGIDVDIYALEGFEATGRFGLNCCALKPLAELKVADYEAIILPGGPQYKALEASPRVQELLKQFYDAGKYLCAICAGPTILGRAGYLKGKNYTCFTAMDADFGGHYTGGYITTDGKIITGKSAAASIDFGFAVLEALAGKEQADKTKKEIYYKN